MQQLRWWFTVLHVGFTEL